MNSLKLKLNPYKDINIVSIDDKPLSPYSELNNYMKEPFLKWADKLLEAIEREINDDYRLVVIGEEFEAKFLKDMQNDYNSCLSYEIEKFQISYSISERYDMVSQLAIKYGISIDSTSYRIPVYSDVKVDLSSELGVESNIENATLYVTNNKDDVRNMIGGNNAKIIILITDKSHVSCVGSMQYVWEIEDSRLSEVINLITERFVKVPLVVEIARQLETKKSIITNEDNEKLAMATEIDMFVTVDDIEDIEVGHLYEPNYKIIPDGKVHPALRIVSSNPAVIKVEGNKLSSLSIGHAIIEFYKAEEIIPFVRKEVKTYQNNYVKKIELYVSEKEMGIGGKQQVNITLIPEDADDIKRIKWSVDNSEIAFIDHVGNIIAKAQGKIVITAETLKAKQSIDVEILPNISSINLSETNIELFVGQTKEINVSVAPVDAYNSAYEWKSSDKNVAVMDKLDDGTDVVRATGIGSCVITCEAKQGNCKSTCNVAVESTFKKRENIHTMLSVTALCMVVALFCTAFSFKVGTVLATIATVLFGIIAFTKNKSDRFWSILLISVAVVAVFW